jgi:4-hydroxybenzoate polyprenyltransferase
LSLKGKLGAFAADIKLGHTVFALPFALLSTFLAAGQRAAGGMPRTGELALILACMVTARTVAMASNRLLDAELDARNPRTASRELPSGRLSRPQVLLFCAASLGLFLLAVFQLDPLVRWLWPIPVAGFVVYPYLKRWSWLTHLWLGAVDGLAAVGAWAAITGTLPWESWTLGAAVACWIASTPSPRGSGNREPSPAHGCSTSPRSFCSSWPVSAFPWAPSTGSGSPPSPSSSSTSTR